MYLKHKHEKQAGIESSAEVQEAKQDEIQGGMFLEIMATHFMACLFIQKSLNRFSGTINRFFMKLVQFSINCECDLNPS